MKLIIPMAGRGERFKQAGYTTPKPLIELSPGLPMFVKAARSFPLEDMQEVIFVVLREHCDAYGIDREIQRRFPGVRLRIVIMDEVTSGQAETVAVALDRAQDDDRLMVFNADSAFEEDLRPWIRSQAGNYAGALQVFRDTNARWSFARVNALGDVVETAEKTPISDLASTGLYYFRSWREYLDHYAGLDAAQGEKYIAPIYNRFLERGLRVGIIPCRRYLCFGTPQDYHSCLAGKFFSY